MKLCFLEEGIGWNRRVRTRHNCVFGGRDRVEPMGEDGAELCFQRKGPGGTDGCEDDAKELWNQAKLNCYMHAYRFI